MVNEALRELMAYDPEIGAAMQDELNRLAAELGVQIRIQKSEIFEAMHQI